MRLGALLAGVWLLTAGVTAQPSFKSGGTTVPVHATVLDRSQRLVTDLDASAFTVLDNDVPRPLTFFDRQALPISVVIMLDTSVSMLESIGVLRDAARQFVANLLPGDQVELAAFNQQIKFVRPFTSSQPTLNKLLDLVGPKMVDNGTALWPAIDAGIKELSGITGRKVLLVFSDGEGNVGRYDKYPVLLRATAGEVMIYAIALKTDYLMNGARIKSVLDARLPAVAAHTGGGYFELNRTDDLSATFKRVAEELQHQYTLGFEPLALDGKTHKITVQVKGAGLTVRARRNYFAAISK